MGSVLAPVIERLRQPKAWRQLLSVSAALLMTACATQAPVAPSLQQAPAAPLTPMVSVKQTELRTLVSYQDRLYRVAAPLLVNNTELCKNNARNLLGFTAKNKYSFSSEFVDAAQNVFGLDDRLQVTDVLAGGGAATAGVTRGDILVSVEDKPLPTGKDAESQAAAVLAPLVNGRNTVKLTVLRNGSKISMNIPLTRACAFGVELGNTDSVNAYSDGHRILLTRGMLNYTKSDDEIAYVLAREMAHNILMHPQREHINETAGGIIDNLILIHPDLSTMVGMAGLKPMPQELDGVADRIALYLVARAGYNIDDAPRFWQRFNAQYPVTTLTSYTALHPSAGYRMTVIKRTVAEIKVKRARKQKLYL
jgi:hypothetical protein